MTRDRKESPDDWDNLEMLTPEEHEKRHAQTRKILFLEPNPSREELEGRIKTLEAAPPSNTA